MAQAFGFDIDDTEQGAVFSLSASALSNRILSYPGWDAELRQGLSYICMRSNARENSALESIIPAAHRFAEDALDLVAVEERRSLLIHDPHDSVVWRRGEHGLKVQITASISLSVESWPEMEDYIKKYGGATPKTNYVQPQQQTAFRYFRYSQAASNVFDAYRNMFLALECLLDHLSSKQHSEREVDWLSRSLDVALKQHDADLAPFTKTKAADPVRSFIDAHYSAVRCAVFHAKNSASRSLRPGQLDGRSEVLLQLLRVQKLVERLLLSVFGIRIASGGYTHDGFASFIEDIKPYTHLAVARTNCPTVEELARGVSEEAEVAIAKVRLLDRNSGRPDERMFVSDIKCRDIPFPQIRVFRIVAYIEDMAVFRERTMLLNPLIDLMNGTLLRTEVDIRGVSKLVIRIRCLLRNFHAPRRRFVA